MEEKVLYEGRPSLRKQYIATVVCAVPLLLLRYMIGLNEIVMYLLLIPLAAILLHLLVSFVRVSCTLFRITDQYVELSEGIFARKMKRAPWLKITNFSVEQTALDRALGLMDVYIDTPGHDQWEVEFHSLRKSEAKEVRALLEEYLPDAKGPECEAK
jgi:uncharacterized membrane protein YdbT with pleckstrin-like domain